jgi:hypothetical protein
MDSLDAPHENGSSGPEASFGTGKDRPSRKLKRTKNKLVILGAATLVAVGSFAFVEASAHADEATKTRLTSDATVPTQPDFNAMQTEAIDRLPDG